MNNDIIIVPLYEPRPIGEIFYQLANHKYRILGNPAPHRGPVAQAKLQSEPKVKLTSPNRGTSRFQLKKKKIEFPDLV